MTDKRQVGWLIERFYGSELCYFSGYSDASRPDDQRAFRTEPETAMRFARREDAQLFIQQFLGNAGNAVEHIFGLELPHD